MPELTAAQANCTAPPAPALDLTAVMCPACGETVGYDAFRRVFVCNDCQLRWDTNGIDVNYELTGEWTGKVGGR